MTQMIETNWMVFAALLVVALLIAVWLLGRATRSAPKRSHRPDVLDEGVAPAQRNQALIDSPPAMTMAPATMVDTMGGLSEVIAAEQTTSGDAEVWEEKELAAEADAGDDLGRLKGVGPKLVAALHGMGVTRYAQIAGWSDADVLRVDASLPPAFQGRIVRDNWVEQARFLAGGDVAGYEGKFGKL